MFRMIKIIFNACLLVLAIIGFNAIGGQKYVEIAKTHVTNFIQERAEESAKKFGNFSNLHEEFEFDSTVKDIKYVYYNGNQLNGCTGNGWSNKKDANCIREEIWLAPGQMEILRIEM